MKHTLWNSFTCQWFPREGSVHCPGDISHLFDGYSSTNGFRCYRGDLSILFDLTLIAYSSGYNTTTRLAEARLNKIFILKEYEMRRWSKLMIYWGLNKTASKYTAVEMRFLLVFDVIHWENMWRIYSSIIMRKSWLTNRLSEE